MNSREAVVRFPFAPRPARKPRPARVTSALLMVRRRSLATRRTSAANGAGILTLWRTGIVSDWRANALFRLGIRLHCTSSAPLWFIPLSSLGDGIPDCFRGARGGNARGTLLRKSGTGLHFSDLLVVPHVVQR